MVSKGRGAKREGVNHGTASPPVDPVIGPLVEGVGLVAQHGGRLLA